MVSAGIVSEPFDIKIEPSGPLGGYVTPPPSKNYSTRMILAAFLAEGRSVIHRAASNDDARALIRCCRAMGAAIEESGPDLIIQGVSGRPRNPGTLNPDNAGAVLRFLLGVACLVDGEVRFVTDHAQSLGRRPNRELIEALRSMGAEIQAEGDEGYLPIIVCGGRDRLRAGEVRISGARSSQFLSSLLFLTPHLDGASEIHVTGPPGDLESPVLVSRPLIDQTLEVLKRFGAEVTVSESGFRYCAAGGQTLQGGEHTVNGDWPSAAALMSAVAVAGGMAGFRSLEPDAQGERRIEGALASMGCEFTSAENSQIFIHGLGDLKPIQFGGDLATDCVLALAGAACFASGTSRISGIGNLKLKETDRIREPLEELARIGVQSRSGEDWIEIDGNPEGYPGGIQTDCRGDHRLAQLLAIVGLRCAGGLTLRGAHCVSKSYPAFFDDLARLGVKLHRV